jgi:hypothetical protein
MGRFQGPIQLACGFERLVNCDRTPLAVPASSQPVWVKIGIPDRWIAARSVATLTTRQDASPAVASRQRARHVSDVLACAAVRNAGPSGPSTG